MLMLFNSRATAVWVVLVVLTVVSFVVGADHGTGADVALIVLTVAAVKVRLVGLDFMELRNAPLPLRFAFEGYCVASWTLLAGMYLWA